MTETALRSDLLRQFAGRYGFEATVVVTAPGRVNLIGDHTDYNGLPVLPMAIQRATRIASRRREDRVVRIASTAPGHESREFRVEDVIPPFEVGDWGNYPKAAIQSIAALADGLVGFDAVIDSDVPIAGGLSSSSALVVASALTAFSHCGVSVPPAVLAEVLAEGERYVGTRGGGMDQATSLLSAAGTASLIEFGPLTLEPVPIPGDWRFVVAFSTVRAEKSGAAQQIYNRRTEECAEALERVAGAMEPPRPGAGYRELLARAGTGELRRIGRAVLGHPLRERFRHVVSEGERVGLAADAMRQGDLSEFGRLMTESHASLRDDYEVSCDELNRLVEIALESGASGARLTGAGFGGCAVAVVGEDKVEAVVDGLQTRFFKARGLEPSGDLLFVAEPAGGASVATL